jgi:N-acetyl-gamma-glutamyl-phosphate reductase
MLRVGIIGARGYTGEELLNLLLKHSQVKINYLTARVDKPVKISEVFPQFKNRLDLVCDNFNLGQALESADLFFLALPHTTSMDVVPLLRKRGKKVIDLSADYRLKDFKLYEAWYKVKHKDRKNLKKAVYGLPEIHKADIREADFIANPGCYSTLAILSLAPLVKVSPAKLKSIIIDAKSGHSGAGRKSADDPFWGEIKDNFKAYKVDSHQHTPEIEQELSKLAKKKIKVTFVPHLLPLERGILETIYVTLSVKMPLPAGRQEVSSVKLINMYKDFYKNQPFIRIKSEGEFPSLRDVQHSNFCDIGIKVSKDKKLVIIISAIDNLLKGASGEAVQNMNLICGFRETEGLI